MMGDDHGWEETGYNGHPHVKTPVLDEMAATALKFERFYAAHPSCSPTRASFLTGRHPNRMGTFTPGWSFRPEEITSAHHFEQSRLSLRPSRQMACRRGEEGVARESAVDGISRVPLA
jgi:arylsulfatase A-like enzyme